MTLFKWSTNAANNATADSTCPFPEGMAASALNDGSRGQMAAVAKYRDDIAGVIVTGGTSTAYTISSNQGFGSLVQLHGAMICFTPHVTNGANGTGLIVDGLPIKPILPAPGAGLPGAVLVQGTPYAVTYNNTDGAYYVHGYFNDPFNVPFLGGMDHWDTVTPNSAFIFPIGQALSRTVYAAAFARWGTQFGAGDGSTTFNAPDKRGKYSATNDSMGGGPVGKTPFLFGISGGASTKTLVRSDLPNVAPTFTGNLISGLGVTLVSTPMVSNGVQAPSSGGPGTMGNAGSNRGTVDNFTPSGTIQDINGGVAQTSFSLLPPSIGCNYIIRIL